jgi:pyruvate kinase
MFRLEFSVICYKYLMGRWGPTVREILKQLLALRIEVADKGELLANRWRSLVADTSFKPSALNLAHYLALRSHDVRSLQRALVPLGVSSLGRCEAHVLPTLDAVLATLAAIAGDSAESIPKRPPRRCFEVASENLRRQTTAVLGPVSGPRSVRIMVTLPTEAAAERSWARKLIAAGTDCARINCAHDDAEIWQKMISNLRAAAKACGRQCRILMDLTGPRARTEEVRIPREGSRVHLNEPLLLTRNGLVGQRRFPFQARCSLAAVFPELKPGSLVSFNEGRIGARVERVTPELAEPCKTPRRKIPPWHGAQFSRYRLHISPLTDKDLADLDFIVRHADLVGYSFVQRAEDISGLLGELDSRRARFKRKEKLGIVAKIETARAVCNLPEIIVRAAGRGPFGVMIARGDLAVEVGYLRVAELQEEILWLCEAAHVPVIWADPSPRNTRKERRSHSCGD